MTDGVRTGQRVALTLAGMVQTSEAGDDRRSMMTDKRTSPLPVERILQRWPGRVVAMHEVLDSTNSEALRLARQGAPHGTVVIADHQDAGRGRLGRSWYSPPGENLHVSLVLRPEIRPREAPMISLAAAVAMAEAVEPFLGRPVQLKWPNDLLCEEKKFCGILAEMETEGGRVRHVVLGVGVDVNGTGFPEDLARKATSLRMLAGHPLSLEELLLVVLEALDRWVQALVEQGPAVVVQAWQARCAWLGQEVTVVLPNGCLTGRALGLADDGALRLEVAGGREERIWAGDMQVGLAPAEAS